MPTSMTIVGDLYTIEERARVQGYLASVWGVAAVLGPVLGGVFASCTPGAGSSPSTSRSALFAGWTLIRRFHEVRRARTPPGRHAGAVLMTVGSLALILGLLEGGVPGRGSRRPSLDRLRRRPRCSRRVRPGRAPRTRSRSSPRGCSSPALLSSTSLIGLAVGAVLVGLTAYVPTYLQGVLGFTALVGGLALATLTIGWPIAAASAGRVYLRIGFHSTALIGSGVALIGAGLLATLTAGSSVWLVAVTCFVVGLGMGWIASPTLIAAQSAAEWQVRGVVTGTNMFARSMGSAVGVAVFGAIANAVLIGASGGRRSRQHQPRGHRSAGALRRVAPGLPRLGGGRGRHVDRCGPDAAEARRAPAGPARLTRRRQCREQRGTLTT